MVSKKSRQYTPTGFYFPPDNDPRAAKGYFRNLLHSHKYMPGEKRQATPEWNKVRVEVNLTVIFEAIAYFSTFWGAIYFWDRLVASLNFHENTKGPNLKIMVEAYCDGRQAFLLQEQFQETNPGPRSRLEQLADHANRLREQTPSTRSAMEWDPLMDGWKDRLQAVLGELRVLIDQVDQGSGAPQPGEGHGSETKSQAPTPPVHGLPSKPIFGSPKHPIPGTESISNGKPPVSNMNSTTGDLGNVSKENTPFFYDVPSRKGFISTGQKRGPSVEDKEDTTFGSLPKRPAFGKDVSVGSNLSYVNARPLPNSSPFHDEAVDEGHENCDPVDCLAKRRILTQDPHSRLEDLEFMREDDQKLIKALEARLVAVEKHVARSGPEHRDEQVVKIEHGLQSIQKRLDQHFGAHNRDDAVATRDKETQEEMNQQFGTQIKETVVRLEAMTAKVEELHSLMQYHQPTIVNHSIANTAAAPHVNVAGRDLSEILAYQPKEFIQAICEELSKLRAVTKSKIHQMDKQGLPDDEKKLAISDLSWQIGKCIKVAEKGVDELM